MDGDRDAKIQRALVTGATGFIGSHVTRALVRRGIRVRALVRRDKHLPNIADVDCEKAEGDLTRPETLLPAMDGCDAVFHVAALYAMWVPKPDVVYQTNVEGTRAVLKAAMRAGVRRVVYTSSVAALGTRPDGTPGDENTPWNLDWTGDHYVRSKHLGFQAARKLAAEGCPAIVVHPAAPLGPGDIAPTPTGKMIVDYLNRKIPAYFRGGFNIVDVEDVAEGHVLAAEKGRIGDNYILGNQNMTLDEIYGLLERLSGVPKPKLVIPKSLALIMAKAMTKTADWITKQPPILTPGGVHMVALPPFYSSDKARRDLGYATRPIEETFQRSIDYFREVKRVKN